MGESKMSGGSNLYNTNRINVNGRPFIFDINLSEYLKVLDTIRKYIDPGAIIAGGYPLSMITGDFYLGSTDNNYLDRYDIDIFFTSPNHVYDGLGFWIQPLLNKIFPEFKPVEKRDMYWYAADFAKAGSIIYNGRHKIDLIQINTRSCIKDSKDVLDSFDINLSQCYLGNHQGFHTVFGTEAMHKGLDDKVIRYKPMSSDCPNQSAQLRGNTLLRVEKYKRKFPDFEVEEIV